MRDQFDYTPDYLVRERMTTKNGIPKKLYTKVHHIICPMFTYHHQENCYKQPVNLVHLAIFPSQSTPGAKLTYTF
jgi:hypothetical protein